MDGKVDGGVFSDDVNNVDSMSLEKFVLVEKSRLEELEDNEYDLNTLLDVLGYDRDEDIDIEKVLDRIDKIRSLFGIFVSGDQEKVKVMLLEEGVVTELQTKSMSFTGMVKRASEWATKVLDGHIKGA